MKQAPEQLVVLIEPIVEGLGYECVGIEFNAHPKQGLLRVYIDSDDGVLLEDCSKVSHQLSGMLDVEEPIMGNYDLEVSSPGTERPLFKLSHFEQFLGKMVSINLFRPINKQRKFLGQIEKVEGDIVTLLQSGQNVDIPFQAMSKARLVPEYIIKKGGRNGK